MKTPESNSQTRKFILAIISATMIFSFVSCSPKVVFLNSTVVPAANGYVKVKKDHNNNYVIQIEISTLAAVEKLQPAKQTYIVWMVTNDGINKNLGRVHSSNKLKVSFETVSSSRPVQIFLTAEENENAQYPGDQIVLSTRKFWDKQ